MTGRIGHLRASIGLAMGDHNTRKPVRRAAIGGSMQGGHFAARMPDTALRILLATILIVVAGKLIL
jgi:hypothetical protein